MKIAVVGNFDKEISSQSSGGTEVFTYSLVSELARRSSIEALEVFAVGQSHFSHPKVKFQAMVPQETKEYIQKHKIFSGFDRSRQDFLSEFRFNIAIKIFKLLGADNYDLVHDNSTSPIFASLSRYLKAPLITTLHTNIESPSIMVPYLLGLLDPLAKQYFVTVAHHQEKYAQANNIKINIVGNVYNGIDVEKFPLNLEVKKGSYGLWVGRISRKHNKGLNEAIEVSRRLGRKLIVVASIDDREYFEREIKGQLHDKVQLISEPLDFTAKVNYFSQASYFLYPIIWEEPFGLVFLEAMACGTPVVAFAHGSVPEVIVDGETGFIVNPEDRDIRGKWSIKKTGLEGICEAVEKIASLTDNQYQIVRQACRRRVEEKFTLQQMADGYEKIYQQVLKREVKN